MDSATPIIVSNWFQWLTATILGGIGGALIYLFHNKADREELKAAIRGLEVLTEETRKDVRELRAAIMSKVLR